jgi:hypothetical protein
LPIGHEVSREHPKNGAVVTYPARVRVTVHSADGSRKVVRERRGGHRGFGMTVGQAIEDAIKAAETDQARLRHLRPEAEGAALAEVTLSAHTPSLVHRWQR